MPLFLSEREGDAAPETLIYLSAANVDVLAKEFGAADRHATRAVNAERHLRGLQGSERPVILHADPT